MTMVDSSTPSLVSLADSVLGLRAMRDLGDLRGLLGPPLNEKLRCFVVYEGLGGKLKWLLDVGVRGDFGVYRGDLGSDGDRFPILGDFGPPSCGDLGAW